jgi:uncharacterized iron-regulated membrane protein
MKFKALKPRLHNIMFHTHTVSGIVICFGLFVIFYAGAFALFMDELYQWEDPKARVLAVNPASFDYDKAIELVKIKNPKFDTTEQFGIVPPTEVSPVAYFYGAERVNDSLTTRFNATINPVTYEVDLGTEPRTHMARTLYELHYFNQIPFGIYISGLVAFFFLFAIITGVLTHWKNIRTKFYAFKTKGKWKQIWTNGHVSLGFITLPFQLIYAVTGALLGLSILLLIPTAFLAFNGNTEAVLEAVRPGSNIKYADDAKPVEGVISFNEAYKRVSAESSEYPINYIFTRHYGLEDGTVTVNVDNKEGIAATGSYLFSYKDGKLINSILPEESPYAQSTLGILIKLHYATYGGLFLKIIYFILAMITCYIMTSGVMIWRSARNNNKYTEKQRRFHHKVTKWYLAITMSMFPAVGIIFLANKIVPIEMIGRTFFVNSTFFMGWLFLTIIGLFWNNYSKLNKNYVVLGSVFALLIPVANGVFTGDWIWKTLMNEQYYVFSVDATALIIGISGLLLNKYYLKIVEPKQLKKKVVRKLESKSEKEQPIPVFRSSELNK